MEITTLWDDGAEQGRVIREREDRDHRGDKRRESSSQDQRRDASPATDRWTRGKRDELSQSDGGENESPVPRLTSRTPSPRAENRDEDI